MGVDSRTVTIEKAKGGYIVRPLVDMDGGEGPAIFTTLDDAIEYAASLFRRID